MNIQAIKNQKFFKIGDIFVYLAVIILLIVLFIVFVLSPKSNLEAIEVIYSDRSSETTIFTYVFAMDEYKIAPDWQDKIQVQQSDEGYTVTINYDHDGKTEYNTFVIGQNSVNMVEADCSMHKECVGMDSIVDSSGIIVCVPHHLTIQSTTEDAVDLIVG